MGLPDRSILWPRFWVAFICTIPVFLLGMGGHLPGLSGLDWIGSRTALWTQFVFTTPVFFWSGWYFLGRFYHSWKTLRLNMFSLIVLGTGAAYFYSTGVLLIPGLLPEQYLVNGVPPVYFEAAAVITTLVLFGQILEQRAFQKTQDAIAALLRLQPPTARRLDAHGQETEVALEEIVPGDVLRVRPGENIPLDGTIIEGESSIDESMMTGESLPVPRSRGATAIGGTLNLTGSFLLKVERIGGDTVLGQIIRLVEQARRETPPVQKLVDRISAVFIPVVLAVAVLAFLTWLWVGPEPSFTFALAALMSVLIIACPCALGLATPVSLVTGIGRGAQAGILVQRPAGMENLRQARVLVFDKTGTLTTGQPRVTFLKVISAGWDEDRLLASAAAVETGSEHPLGKAICSAAHGRQLSLPRAEEFHFAHSGGVKAGLDCGWFRVGRPEWLQSEGVRIPSELFQDFDQRRDEGETVLLAACDEQVVGWIGLSDTIRPESPEVLRKLSKAGYRLVLATGDHPSTAQAIARHLSFDEVHAGLTPSGKQELVRQLRQKHGKVAFIGDGINDAPALEAADAGLAMSEGTDIAMKSADLVIRSGTLESVPRAIRLSRALVNNIRQNLFFAFFYNSLGIPLAAGVLYPLLGWLLHPMFAGLAMTLSSLSVVGNALRMRGMRL